MKHTDALIQEIHEAIVKGTPASSKLVAAAQAVVVARHYTGEDGWDKLKNAIAELEGLLETVKTTNQNEHRN